MSDAMNIKLTVADFEEMDAKTLLGLHNKILESRDEALEQAAALRRNYKIASERGDLALAALNESEHHLKTARHALADYAIREILGAPDEL
jgi:hypothetical protein